MRMLRHVVLFSTVFLSPAAVSWGQDLKAELTRGSELLRTLRPLDEGHAGTIYLEMNQQGQTVGVGELSLKAGRDKHRYEYRYALTEKLTEDAALLTRVEATADPKFTPAEVRIECTLDAPDADMLLFRSRTKVGQKKISLHLMEQGDETSSELPIPERPFVIGASFLLQLVTLPKDGPFALRVFNPMTGAAANQVFTPTLKPDGTTEVAVANQGEGTAGHYRLDRNHRLLSFREPGSPVLMKRTTRATVEQYKTSILTARSASSRPASQPASGPASQPASKPQSR